ncbi:MAG: hypothetical protein ACM3OC_08090 [Deltaproteobacteria bacterium]
MNNRGVALILSFMVILVLTIVGTALIMRSVSENNNSQVYLGTHKAFWLAEAGLANAVWALKNNSTGCYQCANPAVNCTSNSCGGASSKCLSRTLTGGDFDVIINASLITATGSYPARTDSVRKTRQLTLAYSANSNFDFAVFAKNKVVLLNNALVDSYNSGSGLYGGSNIHWSGNVGTNSNAVADITLGNNAVVRGSASTGSGGTISLDNNALISGTVSHNNNRPLASVTVPETLTTLSNLGTMTVPNYTSVTLNGGDYKYTSITMANNGTLTINGTVNLYLTSTSSAIDFNNNCNIVISPGAQLVLYVDGVLDVKNNSCFNNGTKLPANLQVYSTYSGSNGVNINNNGNFYGAVYAPDTDIILANNVACYGSFVGKSVDLSNNADIHYDEALSQVAAENAGYTFSDWQDP